LSSSWRPEIASGTPTGPASFSRSRRDLRPRASGAQLPWRDKEVRFQPFTITKDPINQGLITSVEDVLSGVSEEAAQKLQDVVDREMER